VAITDIWMWAPFVMLLSLAGLSAVPQHLYEAAAIDRAGAWYTFTRITLPLVAPLLLIALIFRTMEAFKTFDIASSGGQPTETIAVGSTRWRFRVATGRPALPTRPDRGVAITNICVKYSTG
jgi:multiple sugar transport system permease protein